MSTHDELWALTSYFNPSRYGRRLANYHTFREQMSAPLITVELSFGGPFELAEGDADILIQLKSGDVLWQKERLLNVALEHLPTDAAKVAWVDCDVIFVEEDWPEKARDELDRHPVIQPFADFYDLGKHEGFEVFRSDPSWKSASSPMKSLGYMLAQESAVNDTWLSKSARLGGGALFGVAWAARTDLLRSHGFYDACIMGNGDRAMAYAAIGRAAEFETYLKMKEKQKEHYRSWAESYSEAVQGEVGFVDAPVVHLWHGDVQNRRYAARHADFARFDFDPFADIALGPSDCWRWNTAKSEMHEFVRAYFASRKEDGEAEARRG